MLKIDLSDNYTRVWIYPEDFSHISFVVSLHLSYHDTLIVFYLFPMIGYVDSDH